MTNLALTLSTLLLACLACPATAQDKTHSAIIDESTGGSPTGDLITNGVITPIDQEMRHFQIRNADGATEVKLTDGAVRCQGQALGRRSRVCESAMPKLRCPGASGMW